MKETEKKIDYHEYEFGEQVENLNACSNTDCTGVVYRAPASDEELEAYREVYDFQPPFVKVKEDGK